MIFSLDHQLQQLRWIMMPNAVVKIDDYHSIISITNPTDNSKMIFRNTVIGVIRTPPIESECIPIMALIQDKNNMLQQTNTDQDNMCRTCKTQFQSRNLLMAHLKDMNHSTKSELTPIQELIFNKINHLDEQQQLQAKFTLNKYQNLLYITELSAIKTTVRHTINTGNHFPIYSHPRRISNIMREVQQQELNKLLKDGIIRPSNSPWSSPVVIVMVHHVPISESDKKKTAFSTQDGLFEFNRLSQGLMNSPPTYQRVMNDTLGHLRWGCCLVYLDDVIMYSPTFEQHLEDVNKLPYNIHDRKSQFKVQTDASDYGTGGVLLQWTVEGYKRVAYVSRTLTITERKYPINEKECLAI
ncbi:unnamed protein product [Didymodactylos carnosus]|nr:unnamed protein product [Didymodactylos carnosus]